MSEPSKKKLIKKISILIIMIIGIISILMVTIKIVRPKSIYPTYKIKPSEFIVNVKAKGEIKAINSYIVNSPSKIWGDVRIIKLAEEGSEVDSGDFLVQLDPSKYQQELENRKNELENALATHESKLANIKKQTADMENQLKIEGYSLEQTKLRAKNAIYEADNKRKEIEYSLKKAEISYNQKIEQIESTKKINTAALRQTELAVEQAKIMVERAESDLSQLTLFSPAKGLVVYKDLWGEKIKIGSTPWRSQPLIEIPDQSRMKVATIVNEVDISKIETGLEVNIYLDAVNDTSYSGIITSIASLAHSDRITKKNVFDVEVTVNESDLRLKPGMSANCDIIVERIEDAVFIPIDAIVVRNDKQGVLKAGGKFVEIETGQSNSDFIIVKNGLKAGDEIWLKKEDTISVPGDKAPKKPKGGNREGRRVIIHG